MNAMTRLPLALALLATLGLGACSSNPASSGAAPLPEIAGKGVEIDKRWSASVGDGADNEFLTLEPAVEAPAVYAASRDGVIKSIGRATGTQRWKMAHDVRPHSRVRHTHRLRARRVRAPRPR